MVLVAPCIHCLDPNAHSVPVGNPEQEALFPDCSHKNKLLNEVALNKSISYGTSMDSKYIQNIQTQYSGKANTYIYFSYRGETVHKIRGSGYCVVAVRYSFKSVFFCFVVLLCKASITVGAACV